MSDDLEEFLKNTNFGVTKTIHLACTPSTGTITACAPPGAIKLFSYHHKASPLY
jgi:hypothetical protein